MDWVIFIKKTFFFVVFFSLIFSVFPIGLSGVVVADSNDVILVSKNLDLSLYGFENLSSYPRYTGGVTTRFDMPFLVSKTFAKTIKRSDLNQYISKHNGILPEYSIDWEIIGNSATHWFVNLFMVCKMRANWSMDIVPSIAGVDFPMFSWANSSFLYNRYVKVDTSQVLVDCGRETVFFYWKDNDLATLTQVDGDDIVFYNLQNTTKLNHYIEYFDRATGNLSCWVNISGLNSTLSGFNLYYGNTSCGSQQASRSEVFDSTEYKAFWTFDDVSDITDQCNRFDATEEVGSTAIYQDASAMTRGYGIEFTGDDGFDVPANVVLVDTDFSTFVVAHSFDVPSNNGKLLHLENNIDFSETFFDGISGDVEVYTGSFYLLDSIPETDEFKFYSTIYDDSSFFRLYKNSILTDSAGANAIGSHATQNGIGSNGNSGNEVDAVIDLIVIYDGIVSVDYMTTWYNMLANRTTFWDISGQLTPGVVNNEPNITNISISNNSFVYAGDYNNFSMSVVDIDADALTVELSLNDGQSITYTNVYNGTYYLNLTYYLMMYRQNDNMYHLWCNVSDGGASNNTRIDFSTYEPFDAYLTEDSSMDVTLVLGESLLMVVVWLFLAGYMIIHQKTIADYVPVAGVFSVLSFTMFSYGALFQGWYFITICLALVVAGLIRSLIKK